MRRTDTVVIGGGQAGLAMSRCLSDRRIEHVVLERGRVAERWRSERWDSLRLLTPNWHSRLPSYAYAGPDPDGFMTMPEVAAYLEAYARASAAPVETETSVTSLVSSGCGYRIETTRGTWEAANVVVATGHCDVPLVPAVASALDPAVAQITPTAYRNPRMVEEGGVLVVGASASGVQIADELARAGRTVTIAAGTHTRLPRRYRGRDVIWWMDRLGVLDETARDVRDLEAARRQPSLQLVGGRRSLDLGTLQASGVRVAGRVAAARGTTVAFGDDLADSIASSERRRARLLARIDAFVAASRLEHVFPREEDLPPPIVAPRLASLDLRRERIRTVVWATGFRREYPWLHAPVLDARGEIIHDEGVTPSAGFYVLGLRFLRTRKSTFLDGVGDDARVLADHIDRRRKLRAAA